MWPLLVVLGLGGCSNVQADHEHRPAPARADVEPYPRPTPEAARGLYAAVSHPGPRDRALDHLHAGVAATELGAFDAAAVFFDAALEPGAGGAAGEPYERAMTHYYRGLLHLVAGDYDAARATFGRGAPPDAAAGGPAPGGRDDALLAFLQGWALQCLGDRLLAESRFWAAADALDTLHVPDADDNVLLIAETGRAPASDGDFAERRASFIVDGARIAGAPAEDLRRWARAAPDRGAIAGGGAAPDNDVRGVRDNAVVMAVAEGAAGAAAVNPAGARRWDNLPERVHVATLAHPGKPESVTARFEDASGRTVAEKPAFVVRHGRCSVAWARSRPAHVSPERTPNDAGAGET